MWSPGDEFVCGALAESLLGSLICCYSWLVSKRIPRQRLHDWPVGLARDFKA